MALLQNKPDDVATVLMIQIVMILVEALAGLSLLFIGGTSWLTSLAGGFLDTYLLSATAVILGMGFLIMAIIRMLVLWYVSEEGEYSRGLLVILSLLAIASMNPFTALLGILTIAIIVWGDTDWSRYSGY